MGKSVSIPKEKIECLRGHLTGAIEIFKSLGFEIGNAACERQVPESKQKTSLPTKQQRKDKYKILLDSGQRGKKHN